MKTFYRRTNATLSTCAACSACMLLMSASAFGETLKTINGEPIDSAVLDVYVENRSEKPLEQVTADERQALLSELADIYILSTQDSAKKLEKDPHVQAQIELQKRGVLAQAVATEFFKNTEVSEEEIQAEYTAQVKQSPSIQYKARHILVPTEGVATDIIRRLDEGAEFDALAKEKSTGPSGPNGGELGWFSPNQMVKPFADAVALLKDGEYTKTPVQTEFGWHVILREESREPEAPTLESVRPSITQSVQQKKFQAHLEQLRADAAADK